MFSFDTVTIFGANGELLGLLFEELVFLRLVLVLTLSKSIWMMRNLIDRSIVLPGKALAECQAILLIQRTLSTPDLLDRAKVVQRDWTHWR